MAETVGTQSAPQEDPQISRTAHALVGEYLSPAEAARYGRVSRKTIDRLIARGELPAYRVGSRLVRIKTADLDNCFTSAPLNVARPAGGQ